MDKNLVVMNNESPTRKDKIIDLTIVSASLSDKVINCRALDLQNLGPKFGPIPKAKKYVFFPILDEKFPIWQSVFSSGKYQV